MSSGIVQGVPQVALVEQSGQATPPWYQFFVNLYNRTGGANGSPSIILDQVSNVPGATLYRGNSLWEGLSPESEYNVLRMGLQFPEWDVLDGKSFAIQAANTLFSGPTSGNSGDIPTFRTIVTADLDSVAGAIPGTQNAIVAGVGNVGEYVDQTIPAGSPIALTTAVIANVGTISIGAGDWDIWGTLGLLPAGGAALSTIDAWISLTSAADPGAPNSGAYVQLNPTAPLTGNQAFPIGSRVAQVSLTTTIYLSCKVTYSGGSLGAYGFLGARRRR